MSNARDAAKKAIATINRTPAGIAKASALTELLNGVRLFVQSTKAGVDLTNDIPTLNTELQALKEKLTNKEIDKHDRKNIENEIKETESTLKLANIAKQQVAKNRSILQSLQNEVNKLRSEISRAL